MNQNIGVLVPLADRIRWTNAARIVVALLPPLAWLSRPDLRLGRAGPPAGRRRAGARPVARHAAPGASGAAPGAVDDRRRADGRRGVPRGRVPDALADFAGPVGYVLMLHAIAVTLLTSFRTGLKVVLWHSIVLLVAIEAEMSGLVEGPLTGEPFSTHEFAGLLGLLWIAALGTATFAAANERELRRRRYDAEVLRRMAMRLEQDSEVDDVASTLAAVAHDELDATRSAVVVFTEYAATETRTIETFVPGTASTVARAGACARVAPRARHRTGHPAERRRRCPPGPSLGDAMSRAVAQHRPLLVPDLDPSADPWLARALPGAENLLIVPFVLDKQAIGVLALEYAAPRGRRLLRHATGDLSPADRDRGAGRRARRAGLRACRPGLPAARVGGHRRPDRDRQPPVLRQVPDTASSPAPPAPVLSTSVLLVDIDHFKAVNDTYGHQTGDDVLRTIGGVLQDSCRTGDVAARYGGEEFGVILSATGVDGARAVAERLRQAVSDGHPSAGHDQRGRRDDARRPDRPRRAAPAGRRGVVPSEGRGTRPRSSPPSRSRCPASPR